MAHSPRRHFIEAGTAPAASGQSGDEDLDRGPFDCSLDERWRAAAAWATGVVRVGLVAKSPRLALPFPEVAPRNLAERLAGITGFGPQEPQFWSGGQLNSESN